MRFRITDLRKTNANIVHPVQTHDIVGMRESSRSELSDEVCYRSHSLEDLGTTVSLQLHA